ncbi:MAG: cyclomaltodextrinase N-terminal domain-containing protein, partial [Bacteroidetes bacterium]|nr:cyclomaltodextrinase N-terminal domain-containing protein [Bacteroidota bacterium]
MLLLNVFGVEAQALQHIQPPNWYSGLKHDTFQILLHNKNIKGSSLRIKNGEGLEIIRVNEVSNPNYLFVDLKVDKTANGEFLFELKPTKGKRIFFKYSIKPKKQDVRRGLEQTDLMYLIMPDRFANGDETNDVVKEYHEQLLDRKGDYERHGGDLRGIISHLDYIKDLGVNTLWLNPVFENNRDQHSYHGYAISDHYAIDKRL